MKEQEQVEEALKESEERYRAVMEQSVEAIYLYDAQTKRVLESNEAFRRMMGYAEEELIGRQIYDFIDHDKEDIEANIRRSLEEKRRHIGERRYRRKDGTVIVVDTSASVISYNGKMALCAVSRDVTERKRFEEVLKESERRFRSLIQNASDIITILGADGTIRYDSPAIERVLGYGPDERLGTSAFEYMHPEDVARVRSSFAQALDDPGAVQPPIEFRLRHKDGTWRHVEVTRSNLLDDPVVRGVVANTRDVTERKQAEEEIRRLSHYNRTLFEANLAALMALNPRGTILDVNRATGELIGLPRERLIGTEVFSYFRNPQDAEGYFRRVLSEGAVRGYELDILNHDARTTPVACNATVYRNEDGEVAGVLISARDMTDRKRAEEILRKSEERFRSLTQNASDVITILDADGTIRYESPSIERVLGYKPEDLIEKNIFDYVHPADIERVLEAFGETLENRRELLDPVEYRFRHADGSWCWLESVGSNLLKHPAVGSIVVNSRDVTERKEAEEALRESEGRFRQLFERSTDVLFVHDEVGQIADCNAEACRSLGYTREELLRLSVKDFTTEMLSAEEKKAKRGDTLWERAVRSKPGEIVGFDDNELRRKDGTTFPVEVGAGAIDYGGRRLIFASARDLTERKRAEAALAEERNLLRTLIDNMPDFIFVKDKESRFVINNPEHARALGAPEEELVGKTDFDVFPRELAERYYSDDQEVIRSGSALVDREEPVVDQEGNHRWLSTTKVPLRDGDGEISGLVGISRDITDRKALEEQLRHQAFHDPLTELPNRALFLDRLGHAMARSGRLREPVAVLFVDLDDFKRINDSLGHETGDRLLIEVSSRLTSCVRPGDTVARLFGDEFAVLLEAPAGMEDARRVAERVHERLRAPFAFDEREVFVGCSVGIVLDGPDRTHQPKEVLRHADLAMYVAKSRGKNRYEMFNPSMDTRIWERMELENNLRRAIEREEFEVHYQPIVELGSARVVGLEALARWRHPERGLLDAKDFVQIAEYTGLIQPIGQCVFETACRQAREWRERYPDREILMCVNFSASQFAYHADLIPKVLGDTGLDPNILRLEITERAVMDDAEFSIGKLQRLKDLGVGFAIDDYGTGYSCLYYLKRMPVDSLKIDGSFVAGLGKDPGDDAIVSGTIDLAHALGLKVVAEGVETAEQSTRLQELNCDLAQGSYFSEPLSVDETSELLQDNNRW